MKLSLTCILAVCACVHSGSSQTLVGGRISSDCTWSVEGSPYIATTNILVDSGVTLTISPGVTVRFNRNSGIGTALQIKGTLVARGTLDSTITFTSGQSNPVPGDWGYVFFSNTSADAEYDTNGLFIRGSILEYCNVEYAGGVVAANNGAVRMDNAHPFIHHTTIQHASASGLCGWNLTGTVRIDSSIVRHNTAAITGGE